MELVTHTIECDRCHAVQALDGKQARKAGWFEGKFSQGGNRRVWDICPKCIADWLDPEDDIAGEVGRFMREDRLGVCYAEAVSA